jgi:hypothetical protein
VIWISQSLPPAEKGAASLRLPLGEERLGRHSRAGDIRSCDARFARFSRRRWLVDCSGGTFQVPGGPAHRQEVRP